MTGTLRRVALVVLALSAGACDTPVGPGDSLLVDTDKQTYTVGQPILVTLENTGETEFVLARCGDQVATTVEVRTPTGWVVNDAHAQMCPAIYTMVPLELAPGERYEYELPASAEGEFRLRIPHASDASSGGFHSDAFVVTTS